jgi:indole-3-glycerol phosphate synthase
MNILQAIVEHKRVEVLKRKQKRPLSNLKSFPGYKRKTNPIGPLLPGMGPSIIAEFKRKSPSKGDINLEAEPIEVAKAYQGAGVAAMSILTDRNFFGGSFQDLLKVREALPELPLLRKDFMIDSYQLHEASAYGADMILLIAAILEKREIEEMALEAQSLGLQVLLEVHNEEELEKHHPSIRFVGVNNRDLRTFNVDTSRSLELINRMPDGVISVSESGLSQAGELEKLARSGYRLFLLGETFMKEENPGEACKKFMDQLQNNG